MKKKNIRIKNNITFIDQIAAIDMVVNSAFTDGKYTPFFVRKTLIESIVVHFIDGIEFDENESIYDAVFLDKEILDLVGKFFATEGMADEDKEKNAEYINIQEFVAENAMSIIEFEKEKVLNCTNSKERLYQDINDIASSITEIAKNIVNAAKPMVQNPENISLMTSVLKKMDSFDVINESALSKIGLDIIKEMETKNAENRG
jgi:hypothetical protein|nr:MAG TPA: hypothetical protein [Caudoviricetes sp.]